MLSSRIYERARGCSFAVACCSVSYYTHKSLAPYLLKICNTAQYSLHLGERRLSVLGMQKIYVQLNKIQLHKARASAKSCCHHRTSLKSLLCPSTSQTEVTTFWTNHRTPSSPLKHPA